MRFVRALPSVLVFVAFLSGCPAQYEYASSAPPVERTVALVESDPSVASALGSGVSVSLMVARVFDRSFLDAKLRGRDRVHLLTKVSGANGEAWLDVDAVNVNEQGWAGRFSVRSEGTQVLREGRYESVGAGVLLEGEFAPDGTPIVKSSP